ncbi:MAG: M23 family metallopeptidase [Gammaproteobacteria bacterium]|nr:M23 family metallopeptidase [Gammaproteobacteria bacterium]
MNSFFVDRHGTSTVPSWRTLTVAVVCLVGGIVGGYSLGLQSGQGEQAYHEDVKHLLKAHERNLEVSQRRANIHLDALALRLGAMQSELYRLEALGAELAKAGDLNLDEFNFSETPPRGGLSQTPVESTLGYAELAAEIDRLSSSLDDRAHKLTLMRGMILDGRVLEELTPQGKPVKKGWISSSYGYRTDPFTGKKSFHHGIDIAGKRDSDVLAVASGVVTEAGRKSGYGYLVEITHADGLVTRYGHNSKIFVETGDFVTKGDVIGQMGSTGRSTGPHVHFEIARNGKTINPLEYLPMN